MGTLGIVLGARHRFERPSFHRDQRRVLGATVRKDKGTCEQAEDDER